MSPPLFCTSSLLLTIWGILIILPPNTAKVKTTTWEIGLCKSVTSTRQNAGVFKAYCGAAWESSQLSTNAALYKRLQSFSALKEAADLINPGGILRVKILLAII